MQNLTAPSQTTDERRDHKDSKLKQLESQGTIKFEVVSNDGTDRSLILLTGAKNIFQKQLPKMPKDYITRLVYDRKHSTLLILKNNSIYNLVGAITYRAFLEQKFVEIVFCAVSSDEQVQGFGAFMMNHLKEHVKRIGQVEHFLTYADNYAVGYFKKQGFTKEITLPKQIWQGCIKDYDGGTLMLCTLVPRINYNEIYQILEQQKSAILHRIRQETDAYTKRSGAVVHEALRKKRALTGDLQCKLDPREIPGVLEAGWTEEMAKMQETPRKSKLYEITRPLLTELQNHASSWPFLQPVNKNEVPDYYDVIKEPMDLSTVDDRVESERYVNLNEFVHDVRMIILNCKTFNDPSTQYYKCAEKLDEFFNKKIETIVVE